MRENPLLSSQIKLLSVRIHLTRNEEVGSGIIYISKSQKDKIYILTAKHCVCGQDFTIVPRFSDIEIEIFNNEEQCYNKFELPNDSSILYFEENEKDIAIIAFSKENLSSFNQNFSNINLIEDSKGIRNSSIFGFPAGSPDKSLERIDTVLQLPTEISIWKSEPQRPLEAEEFHSTISSVKGFSGSGFLINAFDEFYLYGIVTGFSEWNRFLGIKIRVLNDLLEFYMLPLEPFYQIESDVEIKNAITFLDKNSETIRTNIQRKSSLGGDKGVVLERNSLKTKVSSKLANKKVVIIAGHAGYGKSVLAEKVLALLSKEYSVLAIKAEQLINKSIDDLLWENKSNAKFSEVLNSPLLLKQKIILVDSTERLLETQELDGLESLLDLVDQRDDLKLLFTIRDYSLSILLTMQNCEYVDVHVPNISDSEMEYISKTYPDLEGLLQNRKLRQILRVPFYLNYVLRQLPILIANKHLNERKLKVQLWKTIIEKSQVSRGVFFEELALKRANEMSFYIALENTNEKVLKSLLEDEIIIRYEDKYGNFFYAPAHDIFEDWALVKFIQKKRLLAEGDVARFYTNIGNAFAVRRGFRFWLQEELSEPNPTMFFAEFILPSLPHVGIHRYWKDEILVSILLSNHCVHFLNENKEEVLKNNAFLLIRLIHLLRTACRKPFSSFLNGKDRNQQTKLYSFNFEPIGESWVSIISFIHQNENIVEAHPILVLGVLLDWEKKLYGSFFVPAESRMVGEILLKILSIEDLQYFNGLANSNNESVEKGLTLLLRLVEVMKDEVLLIIEQSLSLNKAVEENYRKRRGGHFYEDHSVNEPLPQSENLIVDKFHGKILELTLSCLPSRELCYFLPDIIIKSAKQKWLLKEKEIGGYYSSMGDEHYFGLVDEHKMKYFPASAFQTPTYFLLMFHPAKALDFIIDIVNFSTECYRNSSFGKESGIIKNFVTLNSGNKVLKWSNITLWAMYRDSSIGTSKPCLLKSMMMALEKWMLSLGKSEKEEDHKTLIFATKFLLEKSNSTMTTAVVSSVAMAYPIILKLELLPIFSERDFFHLDNMRWIYRKKVLSPSPFPRNHIHRKERLESFNLEHRNEFLEQFFVRLSFNKDFVESLCSILDAHYRKTDEADKAWLLALSRMDRRLFNYEKNPKNQNQILISPKIDEDLQEFVDEGKKEIEKDRQRNEAFTWVTKILSDDVQSDNTFENWKKHYQYAFVFPKHEMNLLAAFSCSSAIAYIGIAYYLNELDDDQKTWCLQAILETGNKLIEAERNRDFLRSDTGFFDEKAVIKALPFMLNSRFDKDVIERTKVQIIAILTSIDIGNGVQKPLFEYLTEKLWELNFDFSIQCFRFLYYYSFLKTPQYHHYRSQEEYENELQNFNSEKEKLTTKAVNGELSEIEDVEVVFNNFKSFYFDKLFNFLPERVALSKGLELFRREYEKALVFETFIFDRKDYRRKDIDLIRNNLHFQEKYGRLLFFQDIDFCHTALRITLSYVLSPENKEGLTYKSIELISDVFFWLICLEDTTRNDDRFWCLWEILYTESLKFGKHSFASTLLLSTRTNYLGISEDWKPLHGKEIFLKEIIQKFGKHDIDAVVRLLSGAGAFVLLPIGIRWMKNIIEEIGVEKIKDIFYFERLVQRAFFLHRKAIQEESTTLKAYIYILNVLVDAGSSSSFYLREIAMSRLN